MDLIRGVTATPRRAMLYGVQGIGKSTWASQSPAPIFIQTEDGLNNIDCTRFPLATSWATVLDQMSQIYQENHEFKTLVVDSLDWLERLIWADVCAERLVSNIEDIGYGKGYLFAGNQWRRFIAGLEAIREKRKMMIILLAHSKIERFENPETDSYDRYSPKLHKAAAALIQEWADEVFFASYKVYTKRGEEKFNQTKVKGVGTGQRIIRTSERPAALAKNRANLPEELPLVFAEYASRIGL